MNRSSSKEEQALLAEICAKQERRRDAKKAGVPQVGIVFLVKGKIFIDGTPVTEAEDYVHFKIHDRDHHRYWEDLRRIGAVPKDSEYDEVPRGRVVYDTQARKYTLYLDRCILRNKKLVSRVMAEMSLPFGTETSTDSHYRCPACLRKLERADWH